MVASNCPNLSSMVLLFLFLFDSIGSSLEMISLSIDEPISRAYLTELTSSSNRASVEIFSVRSTPDFGTGRRMSVLYSSFGLVMSSFESGVMSAVRFSGSS